MAPSPIRRGSWKPATPAEVAEIFSGCQAQWWIAGGYAIELAAGADDGVVVAQVDGLTPGDLRDLAIAVRQAGAHTTILIGESDIPDEGIEANANNVYTAAF